MALAAQPSGAAGAWLQESQVQGLRHYGVWV